MVQDEVSRPALRQTVMTTNCRGTNHNVTEQHTFVYLCFFMELNHIYLKMYLDLFNIL